MIPLIRIGFSYGRRQNYFGKKLSVVMMDFKTVSMYQIKAERGEFANGLTDILSTMARSRLSVISMIPNQERKEYEREISGIRSLGIHRHCRRIKTCGF